MPTTLADLKGEVAKLSQLSDVMHGLDPTLEAAHDEGGPAWMTPSASRAIADMRALLDRALPEFEVITAEWASYPPRVLELAYEADMMRGVVESVRSCRVTLEKWLGLADDG